MAGDLTEPIVVGITVAGQRRILTGFAFQPWPYWPFGTIAVTIHFSMCHNHQHAHAVHANLPI